MSGGHYRAYELTIASEIDLPELPPAPAGASDAPADVTIRRGRVDTRGAAPAAAGSRFWARGAEACHVFEHAGAFLVRGGAEIWIDALEGAAEAVVRLSLLGPALGLVLHQRGHFVLHASAVALPNAGGAVVLAGFSGTGKSTAAALLCRNGYSLVSDDVTALDLKGERADVLPGYPQCKLWPGAYLALGYDESKMTLVNPAREKRALRMQDEFCARTTPLRCICMLEFNGEFALERLAPQREFSALMCHWYGARFGREFFGALDQVQHFRNATALIQRVPIVRLVRPRARLDDPHFGRRLAEAIASGVEERRAPDAARPSC